jgi:PAS domain S-box-containing protein
MTPCGILVVDDEKVVLKSVQETLNRLGYEVKGTASSGEEAIRKAAELKPDLVLMDIVLPGMLDGIQAAEQIVRSQEIPIVYMTALADSRTLQRAKQVAPYGYVHKPVRDQELHTAIEVALSRQAMERKARESQHWLAATLHCISEAVVATDPQGRIKFMSAMAEALTDTKQEDALGEPVAKVVRILDLNTGEPVENFAPRYLREESGFSYHRFQFKREDKEASIGCSVSPIREDRKKLLGFVLVFREAGDFRSPIKGEKESDEPA